MLPKNNIDMKRLYNLSYKGMDISLSYIYLTLEKTKTIEVIFSCCCRKLFFNTNITSQKRILKKLILANFYFHDDVSNHKTLPFENVLGTI